MHLSIFTARCTLVQSAVLRSHVVCLSSICNVGGSGTHRLEILKANFLLYTDNYPQHLRSSQPKGHLPIPRGTWGNLGETRCGWGKVVCGSRKVPISLKRVKTVKIEEKLLWGAYRNSTALFRTALSPTLYGLPFRKIGGSQPPPQTPIAIISETGEATDFKFGRNIHRVYSNKSPLKILEKREPSRI